MQDSWENSDTDNQTNQHKTPRKPIATKPKNQYQKTKKTPNKNNFPGLCESGENTGDSFGVFWGGLVFFASLGIGFWGRFFFGFGVPVPPYEPCTHIQRQSFGCLLGLQIEPIFTYICILYAAPPQPRSILANDNHVGRPVESIENEKTHACSSLSEGPMK